MIQIQPHRGDRNEYLQYREDARDIVHTAIEHWNQLYNFDYNRIAIRNQRTRWGSCSEKGNLNFNYRLVFLPEQLVDYVVVHELAHLHQLNHSRQFWDLVGHALPEWREQRRALRQIPIRWVK